MRRYVSRFTGGGVHEPSVTAVCGQYARRYSEKSPLGAGSQFARGAASLGALLVDLQRV